MASGSLASTRNFTTGKIVVIGNVAGNSFLVASNLNTLVGDSNVNRTTLLSGIRSATVFSNNNNTFYVIEENGVTPPTYEVPTPPPIIPVSMYQKTSATSYEATTDGETVITLTALAGKNITQIEKNIQPLTDVQWSWNKVTGQLTLVDAIGTGEKLFIIYNEMITT